ncbi:hypothetical protein GYB57_05310 [bacterium]|nr:hypothetical protein [bacterium]
MTLEEAKEHLKILTKIDKETLKDENLEFERFLVIPYSELDNKEILLDLWIKKVDVLTNNNSNNYAVIGLNRVDVNSFIGFTNQKKIKEVVIRHR